MVRLREDGTFSVCAVGYSIKLEEFKQKNECPCVAQWPSGGYLCSAWGSATLTIIDGNVIAWSKPCTFEEAQTCPFFKDEKPANSDDWIYWVRRRNDRLKGKTWGWEGFLVGDGLNSFYRIRTPQRLRQEAPKTKKEKTK